jgi:hypothetical protein
MAVLWAARLHVPFLLGAEFIANTSVVTLCVNASDSYFGLSQKIMMSFHAVMKLRALSHVTHMLKIDDTDVLEGTWSGFDAMALQQQLQTTLAAVDYAGRRLTLPPADGGNGLGYRTCMLHPTLLDQPDALSQYWRQRYVQDWPSGVSTPTPLAVQRMPMVARATSYQDTQWSWRRVCGKWKRWRTWRISMLMKTAQWPTH